jgi:sugar phosphate isomerase/epimerase
MLRYGAMNNPVQPVMDELERVAAAGMDYLELTLDPPGAHYQTVKRLQKEILKGLERHELSLVCHMPTFVYTADLTKSLRRASQSEVRRSLEVAVEMGAEKVVLHPSMISGMGPLVMDTAMQHARAFLDTMVNLAQAAGIKLCLENMFPRCHAFFEPDHFQEALDGYPDLRLTLDIGHASIQDDGERVLQFIRRYGGRIGHLHISDNNRRRDDHIPVGAGAIDFVAIVRALKNAAYSGTATLEIFTGDDRDLIASRKAVAALWETG